MIGYAFWGFLGDKKFNDVFEEISTPDGNAFYSWSIIRELQKRGKSVCYLMDDRDKFGFNLLGAELFGSWCKHERTKAYLDLRNNSYYNCGKLDLILLEWRWEIEGRNELHLEGKEGWQPDLKYRNEILKKANDEKIPLIVFDLDYKLTEEDIIKYNIKYVIELGDKWKNSSLVKSKKIFIPFDFEFINVFAVKDACRNSLIYVGNRYERDWCIDKYIPEDLEDCIIYGNWKESGRDSEERWNKLNFGNRLQTAEMYDAYSNSIATILLAKKEYCDKHFMTARIIESVFYGSVPLFIKEYGDETIMEYAGKYSEFLVVKGKEDVKNRISILKNDLKMRKDIILYLREHLRFMDCKFFVDDIFNLTKE